MIRRFNKITEAEFTALSGTEKFANMIQSIVANKQFIKLFYSSIDILSTNLFKVCCWIYSDDS